MVKNDTPLKIAGLLLLMFFASGASAKISSELVKVENHVIDLREFAASLKWESAPQTLLRAPSRGTAAPDTIRWIDRIYNLPDYMRAYYDQHCALVKEVLDGGSNYLSDPDADDARTIQFSDGAVSVILNKITRKIEYTFPDDVDYTDPYARQQYAVDAIYNDIAENMGQHIDEVRAFIPYMFMSMSYDNPQAFWLGNYWSWGAGTLSYIWDFVTAQGRDSVEYTFGIFYNIKNSDFDTRIDQFRSVQAVSDGVQEFKSLVDNILENAPINRKRYEQIRYINNWLTTNNAYSTAYYSGEFSPIVWSPISALRGTCGAEGPVCEGYSRAFKILCNQLGIPCMLAVGDAYSYVGATPESHMWNEVKMNDGYWYAVDVTWNDPVCSDDDPKTSGSENEKWLLLGRNDIVSNNLTFSQSHPNSLIYGQDQVERWEYDNETLIADTHFDVANGISQTQAGTSVTVYSIVGIKMGTFSSIDEAVSSLENGIYIINGRKFIVK